MMKPILLIVLLSVSLCALAQYRIERYDTSYYMSYRNKLTLGAVANKKQSVFKTDASNADQPLRYLSNSPSRFGIAATHDFLGIAATFGVGALDPTYSKDKGKTKQSNWQLSITGRKILADFYIQKYKGLYRVDEAPALSNNKFAVRPDIETALYGTTVNLIHNQKKFSAQAAFLLDAWQKKSAGSLLYGGEFFYGSSKGDSAFIPEKLANDFPNSDVTKINFVTFGPGLGYGHSFIIKKHFFITGIASFNADVSYVKEWNVQNKEHRFWKFNPNLKAKAAIGYNTHNWGIGLSYVSNRLFFKGLDADSRYLNYNDTYKLIYAQRINAGKTIPKITNFGRKVINTVGLGFLIN